MSTTRTVRVERRVNDYTVVVQQGTDDGFERGDLVRVDLGDRQTQGRVFDVRSRKAVVELLDSGIESYCEFAR